MLKMKAGQGKKECECGQGHFRQGCQEGCPQRGQQGRDQANGLDKTIPGGEKSPCRETATSPAVSLVSWEYRVRDEERLNLKPDSLERRRNPPWGG